MKKIILSVLSLALISLLFSSCEKKYDDFMTGDAKTGGLVLPQKTFPYKLGGTTNFNISIDVPKGPGIVSVEIWKQYTGKAKVLDRTVDVGSANKTDLVSKTVSYDYASLTQGLGMPADENLLNIGDAWTLSYVSIMEDGRRVDSGLKTTISVANFFTGSYDLLMKYFHPTAGGTYPTSAYGGDRYSVVDMIPVNAFECEVYFGVWEDDIVNIHINPDNSVVLTFTRSDAIVGDPYNAANVPSYDPVTGIIKLYYHYVGASGPRIFWAVYTPKN